PRRVVAAANRVMRETIKSLMSFSWAATLFGARQIQNLLTPGPAGAASRRAADAFDAVTRATGGQLSRGLKELFEAGDRAQRQLIDALGRVGDLDRARTATDDAAAGPWDVAAAGADREFVETTPSGPGAVQTATPPAPAAAPTPEDDDRPDTRTHLVLGGGLSAGMGDFA